MVKLTNLTNQLVRENYCLNQIFEFDRTQVIGWPPVKSLRRNIIGPKKNKLEETKKSAVGDCSVGAVAFIKVSMEGAPYLRKVDLKMYESYQQLFDALSKMFGSFTTGNLQITLLTTSTDHNRNLEKKMTNCFPKIIANIDQLSTSLLLIRPPSFSISHTYYYSPS